MQQPHDLPYEIRVLIPKLHTQREAARLRPGDIKATPFLASHPEIIGKQSPPNPLTREARNMNLDHARHIAAQPVNDSDDADRLKILIYALCDEIEALRTT